MKKYFPKGFTPTAKQESVLDLIDDKFSNNKKFLIIQAPTGTGKSFIAKTIANATRKASNKYIELVESGDIYKTNGFDGSFINADKVYSEPAHGCYSLTITKTLQDQYANLFEDTSIWKGKSNYDCAIFPEFEVDNAPCSYLAKQKIDCLNKKCCVYYNRRDETLVSQFSSLSYSKFLTMDDHLKRRQYLVLDEASELEFELVKEFTFSLPHKDLKKKGVTFNYSANRTKLYENLFECYSQLKDYLDDVKKLINKKQSKYTNESNLVRDYKKFNKISLGLKTLISTFRESKYIVERDGLETVFTPLKVDLLSRHIFDHAEKVVLLSATIVGVKNFAKSLGISEDNFDYINIESSFDPEKSPIYVYKGTPLNAKNLISTLPTIIDRIEGILEEHKNEKGIIHTQSNVITENIKEFINPEYHDRLLFREPGVKNETILERHISSDKPTVLVSPSMTYGVDLKDNLGRFQVVVKLPFLPWNDKRAEKIRKIDEKWYTHKMLSNLIQACGRTTRGETDHSVTYIMDSTFLRILEVYNEDIPSYFLKRL